VKTTVVNTENNTFEQLVKIKLSSVITALNLIINELKGFKFKWYLIKAHIEPSYTYPSI